MKRPRRKLIFITGTDTGVGKTVLTVLLLRALRQRGIDAVGLKPFCSGHRDDAAWLAQEGGGRLSLDEVNPYHYLQPIAPRAASANRLQEPTLHEVIQHIRSVGERHQCLVVEGIGGLLVPLTREFTVADLVEELRCPVVVVARNTLGTLNHSLLTLHELRRRRIFRVLLLLMQNSAPDESSPTNHLVLSQMLGTKRVKQIPRLRPAPSLVPKNSRDQIFFKKTLAEILSLATLSPRSGGRSQ